MEGASKTHGGGHSLPYKLFGTVSQCVCDGRNGICWLGGPASHRRIEVHMPGRVSQSGEAFTHSPQTLREFATSVQAPRMACSARMPLLPPAGHVAFRTGFGVLRTPERAVAD